MIYVYRFLVILLIYVLNAGLFGNFLFLTATPNLLILFLWAEIFFDPEPGLYFSVFFSCLLLDFTFGRIAGSAFFAFFLTYGLIILFFDRLIVFKKDFRAFIVTVLFLTAIFEIVWWVLGFFAEKYGIWNIPQAFSIKAIFGTIGWNLIVCFPVYKLTLLQKKYLGLRQK